MMTALNHPAPRLDGLNEYDEYLAGRDIDGVAMFATGKAGWGSDATVTNGEREEAVMALAAIGRRLEQIAMESAQKEAA